MPLALVALPPIIGSPEGSPGLGSGEPNNPGDFGGGRSVRDRLDPVRVPEEQFKRCPRVLVFRLLRPEKSTSPISAEEQGPRDSSSASIHHATQLGQAGGECSS